MNAKEIYKIAKQKFLEYQASREVSRFREKIQASIMKAALEGKFYTSVDWNIRTDVEPIIIKELERNGYKAWTNFNMWSSPLHISWDKR